MSLTAILLLAGGLILGLAGLLISNYNSMAKRRNQIDHARTSLDALFIKRADLIPNLVKVVQQYLSFEKETLHSITAMRQVKAESAASTLEQSGQEAMQKIWLQAENYPDLKANTQFTNLQFSWNEIEEQLSAGRRFVSAATTDYNNALSTFPGNVLAPLFGFKPFAWEKAPEHKKQDLDADNLFQNN